MYLQFYIILFRIISTCYFLQPFIKEGNSLLEDYNHYLQYKCPICWIIYFVLQICLAKPMEKRPQNSLDMISVCNKHCALVDVNKFAVKHWPSVQRGIYSLIILQMSSYPWGMCAVCILNYWRMRVIPTLVDIYQDKLY